MRIVRAIIWVQPFVTVLDPVKVRFPVGKYTAPP
jgi:hypothetical protein